jgi:hypothetical protein
MPMNAAIVKAPRSRKFGRRLGRIAAALGVAVIIAATAYAYVWALERDMVDVAHFVTGLGSLTLAGLTVLAAMLHRWTWVFALASIGIALMILFVWTALFY